jgi:transcriptional regulator with XRE-family HTH domain
VNGHRLGESEALVSATETLSIRLKKALLEMGISQKEAATRCGLPEQTISNILTKNMDETKTSGRIAKGLGINLEWLVYGKGKPFGVMPAWVPIIDNFYSLGLYLTQGTVHENTSYVASERNYGERAFAWILANGTLAICGEHDRNIEPEKRSYLLINDETSEISGNVNEQKKFYHLICELRTYYDLIANI